MVLLINSTPADPTVTDTTTDPPTDGTVWEKDLHDTRRDAIDFLIHSTTNPTLTPKGIIDEVKTARGNLASLGARISPVIDTNGVLVQPVDLVQYFNLFHSINNPLNFLGNDNFLLWSQGDAAAPDFWTLSGAGAAVARTGAGLADTREPLLGPWAVKLTYGAAAAVLEQTVIPTSGTVQDQLENFLNILGILGSDNTTVARGLYAVILCYASAASVARIAAVSDVTSYSEYHPGDATWKLLATALGVGSVSAAGLSLQLRVEGAASAYFAAARIGNGPTTSAGGLKDLLYAPSLCIRKEKTVHFTGSPGVGNRKWSWAPRRPCIVTDVTPYAGTAPGAGGLIFDLNSWDGAALTTMYTTKPTLANGVVYGPSLVPDGTYARRCLMPKFTAGLAAGCLVTLDIDAENAAADYGVTIGYLEYCRPLEGFYAFDTV